MQSLRLAALVVVVALVYATPSIALPSINVVKTSSSTGRLDVITTDPGVLGAEIAIVLVGMKFTSVTINSAIFGAEQAGDNPFLPGSPEGEDTSGLWMRVDQQALFASYQSQQVQAGTYQLLQFEYENLSSSMCTNASGSGSISINGENTRVYSGQQPFGGAVCDNFGDTNGDGITNLTDLNNVRNNFGSPSPPNRGDTDGDGDIDLTDLNNVKNNFGPSPSVAVPEPTSLTIAALSAMAWGSSRRRRR